MKAEYYFSHKLQACATLGGDYSTLNALGISNRVYNLGRVFEHKWIGHVMNKTGDGSGTKPGKTERIVNGFRDEMNLPQRLNYAGSDLYFGNSKSNVTEMRKQNSRG